AIRSRAGDIRAPARCATAAGRSSRAACTPPDAGYHRACRSSARPGGRFPRPRRGAGVVERGGLENRCGLFGPPRVRIPPPPLPSDLGRWTTTPGGLAGTAGAAASRRGSVEVERRVDRGGQIALLLIQKAADLRA